MKYLIWDLPTRIFHWVLGPAIIAAFLIAKLSEKESSIFYLHVIFGALVGLLLGWRLIWGLIGSRHARWQSMIFSPLEIVTYFRRVASGQGRYYAGHNPGSAVVLLALLIFAGATVATGMFMPISKLFEEAHEVLPIIVLALTGLHIAGVVMASRLHHENYTLAMVTGKKTAQSQDRIDHSRLAAAVVMLALVGSGLTYFIIGFDRNSGIFRAPGTSWIYQIGEGKEEGEGHGIEDSDKKSDDDGDED